MSVFSLRKFIALLLVILMAFVIVTGCAPKTTTQGSTTKGATTSSGETGLVLPIVTEPMTLTWFTPLHSISAQVVTSYAEVAACIELAKRTGITIEWDTPVTGFEDQLNLMISSQELPDIVGMGFSGYKGGISQALNDGVAINLNDYIENNSVYLRQILDEFPIVKKDLKTDDGDIIYMPKLYFADENTPGFHNNYGPIMRVDWLEKLGLDVPETMDDWYTALTKFKNEDPNGNGKADEIPFITAGAGGLTDFYAAWGVLLRTCLKDNKVVFGCLEPEFKNYLTTMNKWFSEGLIYVDYLTADQKKLEELVALEVAGANYQWDAYLANFIELLKDNPEANMMQVPWPKGPDGKCEITIDQMKNNKVTGIGISITNQCEHPLEAFKLLDYLYSRDGKLLMDMGIEGVSYNMVDGNPVYVDAILNDPTGLSPDAAHSKYAAYHSNGVAAVLVSSWGSKGFYSKYGDMYDNFSIWGNGGKNALLPMISLTPTESNDASVILADINTYINEHLNKMIMGQEPLSYVDEFVSTIKEMNVDKVIKIYQDAVDRYNNR